MLRRKLLNVVNILFIITFTFSFSCFPLLNFYPFSFPIHWMTLRDWGTWSSLYWGVRRWWRGWGNRGSPSHWGQRSQRRDPCCLRWVPAGPLGSSLCPFQSLHRWMCQSRSEPGGEGHRAQWQLGVRWHWKAHRRIFILKLLRSGSNSIFSA